MRWRVTATFKTDEDGHQSPPIDDMFDYLEDAEARKSWIERIRGWELDEVNLIEVPDDTDGEGEV